MCVFHCGSFQVKYKYTVKYDNAQFPLIPTVKLLLVLNVALSVVPL